MRAPESCVPDLRGLAVQPQDYHSSQLFYRIADSGVSPSTLQRPVLKMRGWPERCLSGQERLWQVRTTVLEVVRYDEGDQDPLTSVQITNDGLPRSHCLAQISVHHPQSVDVYRVDLGQTMEVWAQNVTVEVLAPSNAQLVGGANVVQPLAGLVADTQVTVSAEMIEESRGALQTWLTETLYIPAFTASSGAVPAGAREVTYISSDQATPTFRWLRGALALPGLDIGQARPASGTTRFDVPNASHWNVFSVGNARTVSLIWRIQA